MVCIDNILFIHSSIDGHSGCFHFGAVVNNTAVNIDVHLSVRLCFCIFWGRYLGIELLDPMGILFNF